MPFFNSPSIFSSFTCKTKVCVHGELLSSLWSATPTSIEFSLGAHARILPLHGGHAGVQQHSGQ